MSDFDVALHVRCTWR